MSQSLRVAIAQLNPIVGDIDGNLERMRQARMAAGDVDLVVCGELALAGYPPEDLVLKRTFQERIQAAVSRFAAETKDGGPAVLFGAPWQVKGNLHNAAILVDGGLVAAARLKYDLPNYGVFDEKRVFVGGPLPEPVQFRGVSLGVMICEDMWTPTVTRHLAGRGAELLLVLNGSPFELAKEETRQRLAITRAKEAGVPLIYVNLVGARRVGL